MTFVLKCVYNDEIKGCVENTCLNGFFFKRENI